MNSVLSDLHAVAIEADAELGPQWCADAKASRAVDAFAGFFRVDAAALRQDVAAAAAYSKNLLVVRREDRKIAAEGKRALNLIRKTLPLARQLSRWDPEGLARSTTSRSGGEPIGAAIRKAGDFAEALESLEANLNYIRRTGGGGSEQDRLAAALIERLARIWTRHTNRPAPGGASGPFVDFVAAAWADLGFSEFKGRSGAPLPLVDAIGNRVVKFNRRHNREKNNEALCHKNRGLIHASSRSTKLE
ncbi:hypothetical protein N2603_23375 [Bradyrhizobium huanghuaihaiense]|uniref:hypothetical protein n=1 Tax=Bradyrhizobium huanghuaihaiense TaxID=990078 RepID=UPI0021AA85DD|nr:hypothetical protein [Bradyrhizobium sp. CB3035]UWU73048.1 hypothetical protein N2603_23375 [Bradyrhizobium sp. CB3035]